MEQLQYEYKLIASHNKYWNDLQLFLFLSYVMNNVQTTSIHIFIMDFHILVWV